MLPSISCWYQLLLRPATNRAQSRNIPALCHGWNRWQESARAIPAVLALPILTLATKTLLILTLATQALAILTLAILHLMVSFHLAQLNVARLLAPLDSPKLAGFVAELEPVNALADSAPGFVWRLQTDDGDATSIRAFDDDMLLVNLSVWGSLDALSQFVYRSPHRKVMAQRRSWFQRMADAYQVLWWVPAFHEPTVAVAAGRLGLIQQRGPTREAFTFKIPFPAPDSSAQPRPQPKGSPESLR